MSKPLSTPLGRAERAVILAAMGLINEKGFAFTVATAESVRTFFINEKAQKRLEQAVAKLKEVRRKK